MNKMKTFKSSPLISKLEDFVEPIRIEKDGLRLYKTPNNKYYPSVTTVLSEYNKKEIDEWRNKVGDEEADRVSRRATTKGTIIHEMCEYYVLNQFEEHKNKYNFINYMSFNPLKKLLDNHVDNILGVEETLYSDKLLSAGTIDLIAEYDGKLSIIDFKTSNNVKYEDQIKSYFMQTAAYAYMMNEHFNLDIQDIIILMTIEGGDSKIFKKKVKDYLKDFLKMRIEFKEKHGL